MKYHIIIVRGYTVQHGTDPRATGGVTRTEVAVRSGRFFVRCTDSNGVHQSHGPAEPVDRQEVQRLLRLAESDADNEDRQGRKYNARVDRAHIARVRKLFRLVE